MFWGRQNEEPSSPGLASWAFNSIFSKQTPASKYAKMKQQDSKMAHTPRYKPKYYHDDSILDTRTRKNVAWGGEDFKIRPRSSSFTDTTFDLNHVPRSRTHFVDNDGSIHSRARTSYKDDMSLLPDVAAEDDEDESNIFRSRYNSRSSGLTNKYSAHSRLPESYPGKFPSPYISRTSSPFSSALLSSSANKNLRKAESNTKRNKHLYLDSSPPVANIAEPYKPNLDYDYRRKPKEEKEHMVKLMDQNIDELEAISKQIKNLKFQRKKQVSIDEYNELKRELMNELEKSKELYDSYYQFALKYRDLKKKYKSLSETSLSPGNLQRENHELKRRIRLLETKDLESSGDLKGKIKSLEVQLAHDRDSYQNKLYRANERNRMLELELEKLKYQSKVDSENSQDRIKGLEKRLYTKENRNYKRDDSYEPSRRHTSNYLKERNYDDSIDLFLKKYPDRDNFKRNDDFQYLKASTRPRRPVSLQFTPETNRLSARDKRSKYSNRLSPTITFNSSEL